MSRRDPAVRYFSDVYPILRGAAGPAFTSPLTRRMTEPGQRERLDWALERIGRAPRDILDAGCGQGLFAVELAKRGHDVTALDVSPAMVRSASRAAREGGVSGRVEVVQADVRAWTPRRRFDLVLCIGVAEYYPDAGAFLRRLYDWADSALLVTLTRTGAGPRNTVRQAWLGLHGVHPRAFGAEDAGGIGSAWPDARAETLETRWTWCVEIRRTASPAAAEAEPVAAGGGGGPWPAS